MEKIFLSSEHLKVSLVPLEQQHNKCYKYKLYSNVHTCCLFESA